MTNTNTELPTTNKQESEPASKIADVLASVGILATFSVPIPPSVVKSLRKATERMIGGLTDLGMTYVEDMVERRRAITAGRVLVTSKAAQQTADSLDSNQQVMDNALRSFASDFVSKQVNRESILRLTVQEFEQMHTMGDSDEEIDDDWLATYSELAGRKSNSEVQQIFAKILAGEIRKPGSFSPMTLHILSTLTPDVAKTFERFCNLCVVFEPDGDLTPAAFIPHAPFPDFLNEGIPNHGVSYGDLLVLQQYSLLFSNLSAGIRNDLSHQFEIELGGKRYRPTKIDTNSPLSITSIAPLSISGCELRKIISIQTPIDYIDKQLEYFSSLGIDMTEVSVVQQQSEGNH